MTDEFVVFEPSIIALAAVATLPLAWHAVKTHGVFFALIWLGLTSVLCFHFEPRVTVFLCDPFDLGFVVRMNPPWKPYGMALDGGIACYLGALLAKGYVERTSHRGSIPVFVLVSALTTPLVALPLLRIGAIASEVPSNLAHGLPTFSAIGAGFGLAYRLVSLGTENNALKFSVLGFAVALALVAI